jgi:hypothetical protein
MGSSLKQFAASGREAVCRQVHDEPLAVYDVSGRKWHLYHCPGAQPIKSGLLHRAIETARNCSASSVH